MKNDNSTTDSKIEEIDKRLLSNKSWMYRSRFRYNLLSLTFLIFGIIVASVRVGSW